MTLLNFPARPGPAVLDERPAPEPAPAGEGGHQDPPRPPAPPAAGDGPERPRDLRPVIPAGLRRENIAATARHHAGLSWHRARYHGLRTPLYVLVTLAYSIRGFSRLTGRLMSWWQWRDGWQLESAAVAAGRSGHNDAMRAHVEGKRTRAARGRIVAATAILALVLAAVLVLVLPAWAWAALAVVLVLTLARHGKPAGKPVIRAATVPTGYAAPTPAIITRALASLGITAISQIVKDGPGIAFVTDVHRDGPGWTCDLDLPHGVTAKMILARREQLASGLRRPLSATWPEPVPSEHEGRLRLWIGYQDLTKARQPAWPLARSGQADVFAAVPFGTDPRSRPVTAALFEHNYLIGAAPGQGKTSAVRVLACAAALDPLADVWIHELAGKGDLEPLAQIAHRYCSGLDDEAIGYAASSLKMLRTELERRSGVLKKVPRDLRPDGKITRDLAGRPGLGLRPLVAVFDEVQNCFQHPRHGGQAADDAAYVIRLGRAYGIVLILATQRPTSESVPTAVTGIVDTRFCLKVPAQPENDTILGTGAYKAGFNAAAFRAKTDAGLGWLRGEGDPQIARTYYLDLPATEKIASRARALRSAAGVLSGYALGQDDTEPPRSFAADVLTVFGSDAKLWTETIAARLRDQIPAAYADLTPEAAASQLRALGVTVKDVREPGQPNRKGCHRADLETITGTPAATTGQASHA